MSDPQQPEIRRSGRGDVTQEGRRRTREEQSERQAGGARTGPVPPENRPGHHPDDEQDQPQAQAE